MAEIETLLVRLNWNKAHFDKLITSIDKFARVSSAP